LKVATVGVRFEDEEAIGRIKEVWHVPRNALIP
jgi:hypothetical protein